MADVDSLFVQIMNGKNHKVYLKAEECFNTEEAKENCCCAFASLRSSETGWTLENLNRYANLNSELDFYEEILSK